MLEKLKSTLYEKNLHNQEYYILETWELAKDMTAVESTEACEDRRGDASVVTDTVGLC